MAGRTVPGRFSTGTTHPKEYDFSYEEVQQIVDAIGEWVFVKNYEGEYVLSNEKQAAEAYGTTPERMLGTTDIERIDVEVEEEKVRGDDLEVMETGEAITIPQERITGDDGTEYILRTVKQPFETDVTDGPAMIGVATDIGTHVESDKLVDLHRSTQDLIEAGSAAEIGEIAVTTITEVLGLDYCTVWETAETGDRLELVAWSGAVADNAGGVDLSTVTAGPGDAQWERFESGRSTVETKVQEGIDPADLPVEEPLASLVVLPTGEYGLVEVGSFEKDLFTDHLARILASSVETAFGRLERERELRRLAREVDGSVSDVVQSTDEVARMSQDINDQAAEQVETMDSISAEVDRMSANIEEIAATATEVESTSERAAERATEGRTSAEEATEVIDDVTDSAERVVDDVEALQERVAEIDTIVDVINDIAEQTNIRALNASIEAAKADESGDAFEIVADEVKTLAGESKAHAADIEDLVGNVQQDTEETVEGLTAMVELIEQGSTRVDEVTATLVEITDAVDEATAGIADVADATDDQASSAEAVASRVDDATRNADEVAEQTDRIATANEEIADTVSELQTSVSRLAEDR